MPRTTKEKEQNIIYQYTIEKLGFADIASSNQTTMPTVIRVLNRNDIPKRGFNSRKKNQIAVDEDYFTFLNTQNKLWVTGFIAADGSLYYANGKYLVLNIALQAGDDNVLEKIKKEFKSSHSITYYDFYSKKYDKSYPMCRLQISRGRMLDKLVDLGIKVTKSQDLKMPKGLTRDDKRHFIRGYHCGNGGWAINDDGSMVFTLCGPSKEFITECRDFIAEELGLNPDVRIFVSGENKKCWNFAYGGNIQCLKIYHWMYDGAELYLDRKFKKSTEHFEKYLNKRDLSLSNSQ